MTIGLPLLTLSLGGISIGLIKPRYQFSHSVIKGTRLIMYIAICVVVRMSILDTKVDGSIPSINMFSP